MVTLLFAGGVLFVKYQLESFRRQLQRSAESRVGAKAEFSRLSVYGLRGIRIDDLQIEAGGAPAAHLRLRVPTVYVFIDLVDLVYGAVNLERIQLDGADIVLERPEKGGLASLGLSGRFVPEDQDPSKVAFRVMGTDCRVTLDSLAGGSGLQLSDLDFDLSRLPDSPDTTVRLSGLLNDNPEKCFQANVRFSSIEDFDLRAHVEDLTVEDVNAFLPSPQQFVVSGRGEPSLRIAGYPQENLVVAVEMPFEDLVMRDQPEFLLPNTGSLHALGNYHTGSQVLRLTTAKAVAGQFAGELDGTVSLAGPEPLFSLDMQVQEWPVEELLQRALGARGEMLDGLEVEVGPAHDVRLHFAGPVSAPVLTAQANVSGANLAYRPAEASLPTAELAFGLLQVSWASGQTLPAGNFSLTDGTIAHAATGLKAQRISGNIKLEGQTLSVDPLSAEFLGNPLVGRLACDIEQRALDFTVSGVVGNLDAIPISAEAKDFAVAGAANLRSSGRLSMPQYELDAALDLTQAQVDFEWWFRKPIGIGASIKALHLDMRPKKTLRITGNAAIDTTELSASLEYLWRGGKWEAGNVRVKAPSLDVVSAGKCLRIPYAASGGTGTDGSYERESVPGTVDGHIVRLGGFFDDIALLPDGCPAPVHCKNARVDVTLDNSIEEKRTAAAVVRAEEARLPALGNDWLLPLRPEDPALAERYEEEERDWTFDLAAARLEMPPWQGTAFEAQGYSIEDKTGLTRFFANVGEGSLEGKYEHEKADNINILEAAWANIPARYLLEHLGYPDILSGTLTGQVSYRMDQDDPSTLKGQGFFDIRDGQFSADYIFSQFEEQLNGDMATLPPSLKFSRFSAQVELEGDIVRTRDMLLELPGIRLAGAGQYVVDGDMDYALSISISPEAAEQMPVLGQYLLVDGHKLTQNAIELTINIKGPTFNWSSEVTGLPAVGVTLVSGAAEVTSEAIKIIDTPRQILIDLLKIGGGLVGVGQSK